MHKSTLIVAAALTGLFSLNAAAETTHSIKLGYAAGSSATISGKHLNLYNLRDPSSYKVEQTHAEDGELSDIFSFGYQLRKPLNNRIELDLGASLVQANMAAQKVRLVSQQGPFQTTSNQPDAHARYLELYLGGVMPFAGSATMRPYIGGGLSLIYGKAYKTYYNLEELLAGAGTYGQSGSANMDGMGISLKAGLQFNRWALELSHGRYDAHIDNFRSFEIDGADLEFRQTMLGVVFAL